MREFATSPSGHGAVALLVLLARPARAWRVAGHLAARGLSPGSPAGLVGVSSAGHHALRPGSGWLVLADQLHPEDVPHELLSDGLGELLEHLEGLPPILGEGVALAERPE